MPSTPLKNGAADKADGDDADAADAEAALVAAVRRTARATVSWKAASELVVMVSTPRIGRRVCMAAAPGTWWQSCLAQCLQGRTFGSTRMHARLFFALLHMLLQSLPLAE